MSLVDLRPRLHSPELQALLLHLVGWRDDRAANHVALERTSTFYRSDSRRPLLGRLAEDRLVGLIGLSLESSDMAILHHIAVHPELRKQGIGRAMIAEVCSRFGLAKLTAETDDEAVGFYSRLGFRVERLGEIYPNTQRYRCTFSRTETELSHSTPMVACQADAKAP